MKVVLVMAMTADGIIAHHDSHFPDWTGSEDKKMFKQVSQQAGVIVMGSRTYDAIGRPLPGRLNVVMTRRPEQYTAAEDLMFFNGTPEQLLAKLAAKGFETVILAGGAIINSLFVAAGSIHELLLTISPKLFGTGLTLFAKPLDMDLELLESRKLAQDTVVLRYAVTK